MRYTKEVRFKVRIISGNTNAEDLDNFLLELNNKAAGKLKNFKLKIDGEDLIFSLQTDSEYQGDQSDSILSRREFEILSSD